jgi:hypothetical protein
VTRRCRVLAAALGLVAGCALAVPAAQARFDPARVSVESDAIAQRFPDPAVTYDTPGFRPGRTDFTSHDELIAFVEALQQRTGAFALRTAGRSSEGRPIPLLVFSSTGAASGAALLATGRPTVLIVAQQHGNEPAGSEASLVIAQRLAQGDLRALLERINVLIVPHANPDGADAFVRDTAVRVDMNRDHLLLRTPEARAIALIAREYQPEVVVDAHEFTVLDRWVTKFNGAMRYDALVQYATVGNLPEPIAKASEKPFREAIVSTLEREGLVPHWYFTTEAGSSDRTVSMGGVQPDTWRNIGGLRNAVSFLLETRGVGIGRAHFKRRVRTHELTMEALLRTAAADPVSIHAAASAAAAEVVATACRGPYVVAAEAARTTHALTFVDPVTGQDRVVDVPWRDALQLNVVRSRPRPCGYLLDPDATDAVAVLRSLGVTVERLPSPVSVQAERYVVRASEAGKREDARGAIDDPQQVVRLSVETMPAAAVDAPAGAFYVSLAQPLGNLAAAALEPDSQNSFAANGRLAIARGAGLVRVVAPLRAVRYVWDEPAPAR